MGAGRPTTYNSVIADSICDQLALGRSIIQISDDPDYPAESTIYNWLNRFPEFLEKYTRARELQAEHYASEIVALADTPVEARKTLIRPDGSEEITIGDAIERSKLQIEARKWIAMKLLPKKYGERLGLEHSGESELRLFWCLRPPKNRMHGQKISRSLTIDCGTKCTSGTISTWPYLICVESPTTWHHD